MADASDDTASRPPGRLMPARQREAWNDEDNATLRRMAASGEPLLLIARALERTQEAVVARARRLKVPLL